MSQYIWFALCGCVYIIHHEDFLTVYYISVCTVCVSCFIYVTGIVKFSIRAC